MSAPKRLEPGHVYTGKPEQAESARGAGAVHVYNVHEHATTDLAKSCAALVVSAAGGPDTIVVFKVLAVIRRSARVEE